MKILICGITGSVGLQTVDVIKKTSHQIVGCTFNNNVKEYKKIIKQIGAVQTFSQSQKKLSTVLSFDELIKKTKPDIIVNAVSGYDGLSYTITSIENKINMCLANKESLVLAGWYVKELSKKNNVKIVPVDSEHSSLLDLINNNKKSIKHLYLTASGGKFYHEDISLLSSVKYDFVKNHPNWKMGGKISIESSTLMNKCFEIIEAFYLFDTKKITPIYHPQSIVHSLIEFEDNSFVANASKPDMKIAVQIALSQFDSTIEPISFIKPLSLKELTLNFDYISKEKFKPIKWADEFLKTQNRALAIVLVVASDLTFNKFKNNSITFPEIVELIEKAVIKFKKEQVLTLDDVFLLKEKIEKFLK